MKKQGIMHADLMKCITSLGHMDLFMIGDLGMPIPDHVHTIDLALCPGIPSFKDVFTSIEKETQIEFFFMAEEIKTKNPSLFEFNTNLLKGIDYQLMPHAELKALSGKCKFAIRTGETTPYPNVILRAGVIF